MREYGQIQCSFWSDPDAQTLSDQGKLLFTYLLTGPHSNGLGCYRLPNGYIQADFGWSPETVSKAFGELSRNGFIERCEETFFVVIPNFLRWNPIANSNVAAARIKEFETVPKRASIFPRLISALLDNGKHLPEPFRDRLETLSKGLPKGYGKQEPTQPNPDPEPTQTGQDPTACAPASQRAAKPTVTKTAETWNAYATAYHDRYGTDPVRNAKVNGQLSQLVDRLGAEEAPQVAAWYVFHNDAWYVRKAHSVDALLSDCEKLRTEFVTGRKITQTQARQTDRKQHHASIAETLIAESRMEALHGSK